MKTNYNGSIVRRFLNGKALEEFEEQYEQAKLINAKNEVTKQDLKIADDWLNMMTIRELSQKYKMTQSKIQTIINRVARYNLKK